MQRAYPDLKTTETTVKRVVRVEEDRFSTTLKQAFTVFDSVAASTKTGILSGADAFKLYDTYGLSLDFTEELAAEYEQRHGVNPLDFVMAQIGGNSGRGLDGIDGKDADLLGIPWRVVVGRGAADGQVELVQRASGERSDVPAAEVLSQLQAHLERERAGLLSA